MKNFFAVKTTRRKYRSGMRRSITNNLAMICSLAFVCINILGHVTADRHHRGSRLSSRKHSSFSRRHSSGTCEPISVPLCKDIGYNLTDMSLSPANITQQTEVTPYVNMVNRILNCAEEIKLLFCSLYTPICLPSYNQFLPPCRFICERAHERCAPLVKKYYGLEWPSLFACKRFPEYLPDNQLCLHFNRSDAGEGPVTTRSLQVQPAPTNQTMPRNPMIDVKGTCSCSEHLMAVTDEEDPAFDKVVTGRVKNCAIPCRSPYFAREKLQFAETWITAWSVACFAVTLLTISTFLIDKDRFKYPERPVILLSVCYMFVSIGFLIRIIAGHEAVACNWNSDRILYNTTGPFLCAAVFLLIYFFGMAGSLWCLLVSCYIIAVYISRWVILTLTWFLAAGLKWSSEAISKCSYYFHTLAWLVPALQSIAVLAMSRVDGDSLSGICYVGNQDVTSLRGFVSFPLLLYLSLGGLFLFLGFLNLFRIRKSMRKVGSEATKLEKLMGRIGLFSLLYMIPSVTLVACFFYEQNNREAWADALNCQSVPSSRPRPEFAVYVVKYSVMLIIGVTNGVWVWSPKTIASWRRFYQQCCSCSPSVQDAKLNPTVMNNTQGLLHVTRSCKITDTQLTCRTDDVVHRPRSGSFKEVEQFACSSRQNVTSGHEQKNKKRCWRKKSPAARSSLQHCSMPPALKCMVSCCLAGSATGNQQLTCAGMDVVDDVHEEEYPTPSSGGDELRLSTSSATQTTVYSDVTTVRSDLQYPGCHPAIGKQNPTPLNHSLTADLQLVDHRDFLASDTEMCQRDSCYEISNAVNRVHHVHHHHHHHVASSCVCDCHERSGHRKTLSQLQPPDSWFEPSSLEAKRKFRLASSCDRRSPTLQDLFKR